MHGGVNFSPYRKQFEALLPSSRFSFLETYNASEGFFGIQDRTNSRDMLLMLDYGIFYEFIPMDEYSGESSGTIPLSEVKEGVNYAVVISSNAGLWRYIIGDTVRFTSTAPYRIQVSGRTRHFINAFGEEVIIENAESALSKACQETNSAILEYTAAPIYMNDRESGAHEWLIEFSRAPEDLDRFTDIMDVRLKEINSDYEAKRHKGMALKRPLVKIARKDLFYDWLRSKGKLGGQHKVPRLSNNRDYMDELLDMNELQQAVG